MLPNKILIVEDEAIVALDLQNRLTSLGYEIVGIAANGQDAQNIVNDNTPDMILMDIQIRGEIDGIETAERIHQHYDIPIIFVTANSDDQTVGRAKNASPFGYLLKPFEERELHTTIEMAIYRHQLEKKLRDSERWLHTTLRCIGDGVIATDDNGCIQFINSIAERLTGWPAGEAVGKPIEEVFNIVSEDTEENVPSPIQTAIMTHEIVFLNNHTLLIRKDGSRLQIDDSAAPIIDDKEKIAGAVLIFRDVSERAKAEKALKASEKRYDTLFHSVYEGIGIVNENEIIEYCNPAFMSILDEDKAEDVLGKSILHYVPEDQHETLKTNTVKRMSGACSQYELDIITAKNIRKTILVSISPRFDDAGVYKGAFGGILDITARRQAEEQLVQYQNRLEELVRQRTTELERAYHTLRNEIEERKQLEVQRREMEEKLHRAEKMESLGLLAGGVAHDLNNTLGPLVGYPDLMLRQLPADSPLRKMVERMSNASQDAANVIQDLLTLARRGRYELRPVNLNRIIEEYLDSPSFLKLQNDHPQIKTFFEANKSLPNLKGSAPHLSKVIMNLIVNAFDAIKDSGSVSVTTSVREIQVLDSGYDRIDPGQYIILSVKDTGCGINPEDISKIFEPYFSKKRMGKSGTGLGLSVVYGVIKDHNGYYDIITKSGDGTEFIFYFPICNEAENYQIEKTDWQGGAEKILIVDDSQDQLELCSDILRTLGYSAAIADCGRKAVELVKRQKYDLIMLDMIMEEDFDGLDTYEQIKVVSRDQKAIVVSGYSPTERVNKLLSLGAGSYLKKPYTTQQLANAVRTELDKKRPENSQMRVPVPSIDICDISVFVK